jgi:oligoendopeptidase F
MSASLSASSDELMRMSWQDYEPYYRHLLAQKLDVSNIAGWLAEWTRLRRTWYELQQRLYVASTVDTTSVEVEALYNRFLDQIYPQAQAADQKIKEKLLASGLEPQWYRVPLRNLRAEAAVFSPDNIPLLSEELKLTHEHESIIGAQTVVWQGSEVTLSQLSLVYLDVDRSTREHAWRLASDRWLEDRPRINDLWGRFLQLRIRMAANAGLPDFRTYRWQKLLRFDYTPQDCRTFHNAIEAVVVPAALQVYDKRRQRLKLESLRPWDLEVDPFGHPPLRPFSSVAELEAKTSAIFHAVDPQLGEYFEIMRREHLLDLDNRKGKAPGAYCTDFPIAERPFIVAASVGVHDDVQTLLHEGGHAFHVFESAGLPYCWHTQIPWEFMEVASMGMELLASPYLTVDHGGFYTPQQAARARVEHLERSLLFWPYMAVVDAFQHWVYENAAAASQPENCDAAWADLWQRFMPGVDWGGLDQEMRTGWQRKIHIHTDPFYYVDYGLALLGATQVWRNALKDQAGAVAAYRQALALGDTVTLPELFSAAGARFAFDADVLGEAVALILHTVDELEEVSAQE